MKILNGRILGDLLGKYTYIGYKGVSTVDYVLGSESLLMLDHIHSFEVEELTLLSDHRPISLTVKYNVNKDQNIQETPISCTPKKNKLMQNNKEIYKNELHRLMNKTSITSLINKLENIKDKTADTILDNTVKEITELYVKSARTLPTRTNIRNKKPLNKKIKSRNIWHNKDCKNLKRKLNQIRKMVDKNPEKIQNRILFYKTQKEYKKLIKQNKRKYEENITNKLENLYSQDKNEFWKYLKSMKDSTERDNLPQLDNLIKHFRKLYFNEEIDNNLTNIHVSEDNPNKDKFDTLNEDINEDEVIDCIKNLKNKKSPGDDQISNEMIQCTNTEGIKLLKKLFNTILKSGYFPKDWNYGLLRLIHKGDDTDNPNNYRAITLNSCLGKLLCTILHQRLYPLLEHENIFCKEQAGFRKNHRTTDHIFLLKNIVKKYISQNKYLYTCFVDFSKAFDSIWRKALIKKISLLGINGNFLNIIKSIYTTTTNSIIYNENISERFQSNMGVKQGDTLSTTLFNLYINDLPDIFNFTGNNAITIGNTEISCLKYADDLIIMSTSHESLQKCITNLEQYCKTWKLEVNMKKNKIVIFNKQGSLIKKYKFWYKNNIIENVQQYKYLGFTFTCSGSNNVGINNLITQAKKAWFAIQYYISGSKNKNIQTYLHLFDTQVKPIMLYACETWADSLTDDENITKTIQKCQLEKFHMSVLKRLLGVHRRTTNIALLLETGRQPITLSAHLQSIKYFFRFPSTNKQSLLSLYYENEKELFPHNGNFINYIKHTLNKIGMTNIWREQLLQNNFFTEDTKVIKNIKVRLNDISSQKLVSTLKNNEGKLTFLASIKETHVTEKYLSINNFENRMAVAKLRTSSHKLKIETGRWNKTPREERICKQCILNKIEDEKHFLFECQMYINEREDLYNTIETKININPSQIYDYKERLLLIFNSENLGALNALGKFVKNAMQKRDNTVMHNFPPHYIYYQTLT